MNLHLYHLVRTGPTGYDETVEMVVAADSAARARRVASENTADESPTEWLDTTKSRIRMIGHAKITVGEGVVIRDVHWG